jgi:hypothetical protein
MSHIDDIISGGSGVGVSGGGSVPSNFKAEEAQNDEEVSNRLQSNTSDIRRVKRQSQLITLQHRLRSNSQLCALNKLKRTGI